MGRGPGAVTLAALPPARAWYSDRGSAVPERRWCADRNVGAGRGRGHLASQCQRAGQQWLPARGRAASQPGLDPREGCRCIFGAHFFLCVLRRVPGVCAPCRRRGLARRARPSLRQWVWTWVGEEGE